MLTYITRCIYLYILLSRERNPIGHPLWSDCQCLGACDTFVTRKTVQLPCQKVFYRTQPKKRMLSGFLNDRSPGRRSMPQQACLTPFNTPFNTLTRWQEGNPRFRSDWPWATAQVQADWEWETKTHPLSPDYGLIPTRTQLMKMLSPSEQEANHDFHLCQPCGSKL